MPYGRIHRPASVRRLWRVLDAYCRARLITDREERETIAKSLLVIYEAGTLDDGALKQCLEAEYGDSGLAASEHHGGGRPVSHV